MEEQLLHYLAKKRDSNQHQSWIRQDWKHLTFATLSYLKV